MQSFWNTIRLSFLSLSLALILVGCPKPINPNPDPDPEPRPAVTVDSRALEFSATDSNFSINIDADGDDVAWTADASQPWLVLNMRSGTGDAQLMITIDRSQLDPSSDGTGLVRVRSGDQIITIQVNAVSAFTPVNTPYFPMAVGNTWTYAVPGALPGSPATTKQLGLGASGLSVSVVEQIAMNGLTVWQVDFALENIALKSQHLKGLGLDAVGGGAMEVSTFWVKVNGVWYLGTNRDDLAQLPNTETMVPLATLLEFPGTLAYLGHSNLLEQAGQDVTEILGALANARNENREALYTYINDNLSDGFEDFYALTNAFGAAFDGYDNATPLGNAGVDLLADFSSALEPLVNFSLAVFSIYSDTQWRLSLLGDRTPSLAYWMAFEAEFGAYTSANLEVQALVQFSSRTVFELVAIQDAASDYSEDDLLAVQQLFSDVYYIAGSQLGMAMSDPSELIESLSTYLATYETDNEEAQAIIAALRRILADLDATLHALEGSTVFPIDPAGWIQFVAEAQAFNRSFIDDNGVNPSTLQMGIILDGAAQFLDELAPIAPTLNNLAADVAHLQEVAASRGLKDTSLDSVKTILDDFAAFFGTYGETTEDALAIELNLLTQAGADVFGVFVQLRNDVANIPFEDVAGSLSTLLPNTPFPYTLADFGVPDQSDCISPRVIVETEEETLRIASTIYARDVGPVLFAFLPLQYATVGGQTIGSPPAE